MPLAVDAAEGSFSAQRAYPVLERLIGDQSPHAVGTSANEAVRERVSSELSTLGYLVEEQSALGCSQAFLACANVTNVLTRLAGSADGPTVLLTAHYDSAPAGPGASDDMVGVTALLEVARLLRAAPQLRNDVIFLISDGEEAGLLGAEAFLAHAWASEVGMVVNLEARGTTGQSMLFETSVGNAFLIREFARHAPLAVTSSLFYEIYRLLPNDTDFSVYRRAGMPGVNFAFVGGVERYHTTLDDLAHVDRGSLQHHGDNLLAAALAFGSVDLAELPTGNAIFVDLWPGLVVQAPESSALWLALACLLLWVLLLITLLRSRAVDVVAVLLGLLAVLLGVALAGGLGFALTELLMQISGVPEPWYAQPLPTRLAVWMAALVGLLLPASLVARRAGFWGLATAVWFWWSVLSLTAAIILPGTSVFLLVPAIAGLVLMGLAGFLPWRRSAAVAVFFALVALFATAYSWTWLALTLETALGWEMGAAIATSVALAFSGLLPLLAVARGRASVRTTVLVVGVLVMTGAGVWALQVPFFSSDKPQRLNIDYVGRFTSRDATDAKWLIDRRPWTPLPAALQAAEPFTADDRDLLPWSSASRTTAPAPPTTFPPPQLTVLDDMQEVSNGPHNGARLLRLRLGSPRGADRISLFVPGLAGLQRIEVGKNGAVLDTENTARFGPGSYRRFDCHGRECDGLELQLSVGNLGALELLVVDTSFGLAEQATALAAARPATAVPSMDGDTVVLINSVTVPASSQR